MTMGEQIRAFRKSLGLTQKEFGALVGRNTVQGSYSQYSIGCWERGETNPGPQARKSIREIAREHLED